MTLRRLFSLAVLLITTALLLGLPLMFAKAEDGSGDSGTSGDNSIDKIIENKKAGSDEALKEYRDAKEAAKLAKLKRFGTVTVTTRTQSIAELKNNLTKGRCESLSATQRAQISSALDQISTNLTTIRQEITDDTTLDETKTDVKKVFSENHVFVGIVPAVNGACLAQKLLALIDGKIVTAITKLKTAGIDTTAVEAKLATTKIDAGDAYTIYLSILQNPSATDLKTKFANAKTKMQAVRKALGDIKSDIGNLRDELEKKDTDSSSPTTSGTEPSSDN